MTLSALLRNPVLCGWTPAHGDPANHEVVNGAPVVVVEGPSILTVAERQKMRAAIAARSPRSLQGKRVGGRPANSLLQGILRCGHCHDIMTSNGKGYECSNRRAGRSCVGMTATAALVDATAGQMVLSHLAALSPDSPDDLEVLVAIAEAWMPTTDDAVRANAEAELQATQERLVALEQAHYVDGTVPVERFGPLHESLTARIAGLVGAIGTFASTVDIGPLLDLVNSREAWEATAVPLRRELVAAAVESVTLLPAAKRGERWTGADRLDIQWR